MQQYDIFISYKRRGASSATAAYLYELLIRKGYNVFFDRKEMRSGKFDEQLLEHISNAKDIIILLEEESLQSWFSEKDEIERRARKEGKLKTMAGPEPRYKSDWFCKELMHALSLEGKNIVPLLLNGYGMPAENDLPPEMKELSTLHAISFDISEAEELYEKNFVNQEYLKSKPQNLALARQSINKGPVIASFLFHTDAESCDVYERGEKITTLTDYFDRKHPFFYPVPFAGEHHFDFFNNDTCEEMEIVRDISPNCQAYIHVDWKPMQRIWDLTEEEIQAEKDADKLFFWGRWLFEGTSKNKPDLCRSVLCLSKTAEMNHQPTIDFIGEHCNDVLPDSVTPEEEFLWYKMAAELGNARVQSFLGTMYCLGRGVEQDYAKAIDWLTKAAKQGYAEAQYNLGVTYQQGDGVVQDYAKALEWYTKAAEQGYAAAQYNLGVMYHQGDGVVQDYAKALEWYTKAAEQGEAVAQCNLGALYERGYGVEQDYAKAIEWFTKSAEQGYPLAQNNLGAMYERGEGVEQDYAKAKEWYTKAAEQGHSLAQHNLGVMYYHGKGVEQDYTKAIEWFAKAAEQGAAGAQCNLGDMYYHGKGVEQDYAKAIDWFTKAAEQGDAGAQYNLGIMYVNGEGVDQDYGKAVEWYTKSAEQGDADAQYFLGIMYDYGEGVEQDYGKAVEWYTKSAEQGLPNAQYDLGALYERGYGVEQDYGKAIEWFAKAAEQGYVDTYNNLAWVYHLMGKYEEALPWAEKAVECEPDNYYYVDTLATVYQGLGRNEEAIEQFERSMKLANVDDEATDEEINEIKENIKTLKKLLKKDR